MAEERENSGLATSVRNAEHAGPLTPASTSVRRARQEEEVLLDTPRNVSAYKRNRTDAASEDKEREVLLRELNAIDAEVDRLQQEERSLRTTKVPEGRGVQGYAIPVSAAPASGRGISITEIHEDEENLETLEAMLREMDDGALAALLTHSEKNPAMEALMDYLPKVAPPTVLPPVRSAGIEGTGSGQQLDKESALVAQATDAEMDRHIEDALLRRRERSEQLADALAVFTGLSLDDVKSTKLPNDIRSKWSKRHIIVRGTLEGDLGDLMLEMDVQEPRYKRDWQVLPQIVTLDVEVNEPIMSALGSQQIQLYVQEVNLTAMLLAFRTVLPLAKARYRLFASTLRLYPALSAQQSAAWRTKGLLMREQETGSEHLPPLSLLVNPEDMETCAVENAYGARLVFRFRITFNRWGHASPSLTVEPFVPGHLVTPEVSTLLAKMPDNFAHLCAHRPVCADTHAAVAATIDAFFDLNR